MRHVAIIGTGSIFGIGHILDIIPPPDVEIITMEEAKQRGTLEHMAKSFIIDEAAKYLKEIEMMQSDIICVPEDMQQQQTRHFNQRQRRKLVRQNPHLRRKYRMKCS